MTRGQHPASLIDSHVPRELSKITLPSYVVEPPDILLIETVKNVRLPSEPLEPLDALVIRVSGTLPVDPAEDEAVKAFKRINGPYRVENDGTVKLGPEYGSVQVGGLTAARAKEAIEAHLRKTLAMPQVSVELVEVQGKQQISGEHLVRPDGTVSLGIYGTVRVAGLTLTAAKAAIEQHLALHMVNPQVNLDVLAYNSKVYYVITDGGGYGEQVVRLPATGNETVLDAISHISGLPSVASKKHIWIARPAQPGSLCDQILPVDWPSIAACADPTTNYQLMPGDRLYVQADKWIAMDSFVAKVTAPFERVFGFTLLGHSTVRALEFGHRGQGFGGSGGGGGL